jgi:endonuclease I
MAVRYEGTAPNEPDLEVVNRATTSGEPNIGYLNDLLAWHDLDPVDDRERLRNEKIYRNYQGNRNPFIDHPEWVRQIWTEQ